MQPFGDTSPTDLPELGISDLVKLLNIYLYIYSLQDSLLNEHIEPVRVENRNYESEATSVNAKVTPHHHPVCI